jgi:trehalose-6-phosphatase
MIIYFGDDDKDEEAFAVAKEAGGSAIRVGVTPGQTSADFMLATPQDVRTWLRKLLTLRHC